LGAVVYTCIGAATLLAALLPRLLHRAPISMPLIFLAAGALAFGAIDQLPDVDPLRHGEIALHLTELCLIVSLMGAGLAIDRAFRWRAWGTTWRLLGITMPLSVLAVGLLGWGALGWSVASAVLLAAALSPTDPVLASEVQVAEPADDESDPESKEDEARFALTSEAGLNDGLAFPFTYAAIAISLAGAAPGGWLAEWLSLDVLWRTSCGLLVGLLTGWGLRTLFFAAPSRTLRLAEHAEGFVALAATFLAYGLTELAEGYGFIAVFVCACTIRAAERSHGYHRVLHQYVEQAERLLTVVIIFLLGGAVASGLFAGTSWVEVGVALAILLIVRPLAGLVGLAGSRTGPRERVLIAFFGVRGIGSLFYVSYALHEGQFNEQQSVWRVVALVVVGSVIVHGITAAPAIRIVDRLRLRATGGDPDEAPRTPV
jgi:sodium/hydrogen antiporter